MGEKNERQMMDVEKERQMMLTLRDMLLVETGRRITGKEQEDRGWV
jgi:hypothetical protein